MTTGLRYVACKERGAMSSALTFDNLTIAAQEQGVSMSGFVDATRMLFLQPLVQKDAWSSGRLLYLEAKTYACTFPLHAESQPPGWPLTLPMMTISYPSHCMMCEASDASPCTFSQTCVSLLGSMTPQQFVSWGPSRVLVAIKSPARVLSFALL